MILAHPPAGLCEADFHRIEEAVAETARGRWFLAEFARRLRAQDVGRVLDAVARLEFLAGQAPALAAREQAGACAERLMDIAWALRERGFDDDVCRALEREAAAVHALSGSAAPFGPALARTLDAPAPAAIVAPPAAAEPPAAPDPLAGLSLDERLLVFS